MCAERDQSKVPVHVCGCTKASPLMQEPTLCITAQKLPLRVGGNENAEWGYCSSCCCLGCSTEPRKQGQIKCVWRKLAGLLWLQKQLKFLFLDLGREGLVDSPYTSSCLFECLGRRCWEMLTGPLTFCFLTRVGWTGAWFSSN